ncbi:hypothetical protein N7471_013893 [Penicillium samsonianum]|uniref:uncharacterized protein n=1 Tax=Penicillium samsonianum TaxID=1882272 RepID=UPI0025465D15|nr:uncharacterized protein N7471_013893 [Penicillium samsonianum]KAJ6118426.1 hypothetical protein N7471_013893 [Penicillium samsonianum]
MALELLPRAGAQGADPTQSLNAALENFQNTLTEEQKREFQKSTTTPDIASVIEFVAEIDARNSRMRTPMAPRLCTFLDAAQQFTGIVDTFVSSNPIIAALVWGGVKTAILTASNVASYFDKVTSMIMRIGKYSPTYQKFGLLYLGCIGLQRALCDFYAIIINLCVKIIEVSRRTALKQILSSIRGPFESEFKPFLDLLEEATHKIDLEVSLASKQADQEAKKLLEYESQQNSEFRPLARKFYQKSLKQQAEASEWRMKLKRNEMAKLKTSIRNNLSPIDHDRPWKQALNRRVPTTAEWLRKELVFDKWKEDPQTAILWCLGTIGMGKTVLMSKVVDQLRLRVARKSNEILSYYFCRVDNETSLSARSIFGSLARQILNTQIEQSEFETLLSLQKTTRGLGTTEVVQFLLSHLEAGKGKKYYVILDGLDECDDKQVQAVAQAIVELCSNYIGFKVLCAGRPGLEKRFKSTVPQYRIMVNENKVKSDMYHYIINTLDECLDDGSLTLGDPTIITEIRNTLRDKADGMFLWASLCIEELCAQNCDHDILEALKNLPHSLAELYDRKLRRVREGRAAGQAMKLLQYCGAVKRPLTVMEYREALSLSLEQKALDRGKVPNDMDRIINDCYGFTFVDEEEDTIHYVHRSVRECLFITNGPHTAQFDTASVDRHLGFLCMTYLDFTNFKHQLTKVKNGSGTPIQPLQLGTSTLPIRSARSATSQMARKLLSGHIQLQHFSTREVERTAQAIFEDGSSSKLELELQKKEFQFLNYARAYWLNHLTDLTPDMNSNMWGLFCRCIEGDDVLAYRPWESEQQTDSKRKGIPEAMQWLLTHGHSALLSYYAKHQSRHLTENVKDEILRSADIHNRYRYTEALVRLDNTDNILNHALLYAALDGCTRSLAVLLQAGVDIKTQVNSRTALQAAAGEGHLEMVQALLAAKADVNASSTSQTALQAAASGGHLDVVQTLLVAKADVNASVTRGGQTALQAAAGGGHLDVVQTLLAAKADVNASSTSQTALQAAAGGGHLDVVQTLLAAKADVNAPASYDGRTALQAAAEGGHLKVIQALLAEKENVNAYPATHAGKTALHAAAGRGYLEVVKALLLAKADVNALAIKFGGQTALQVAAREGHLEVVQTLLAAKADVNAPPFQFGGQTALQAAASGGHLDVVQTLLAAKADVNASPAERDGITALEAARKGGHTEVVQALLAARPPLDRMFKQA